MNTLRPVEIINGNFTKQPFSETHYQESISHAARHCPEVATHEAEMKIAAQNLVEQYKPTPDFFASPDNELGLLFASALYVNAKNNVGKAHARIAREQAVADNFAWLAFGDYSTTRPHEGMQKISSLPVDDRIRLFARYENPTLSADLRNWMKQSTELAEVRETLRIQHGRSRDFVPVVLRAGTSIHMKGIGEAPGSPDMTAKIKEWNQNATQFMIDQGSAPDDVLPFAWVSTLHGEKYLCFPEPLALALLNPTAVGFHDSDGVQDYLKALIKHEYVHVQTNLDIEDMHDGEKGGRLGTLLTEYQAEVFSGFQFEFAYPDIYALIEGVDNHGNINTQRIIRQHKNGGGDNKPALYYDFINALGLVPTAMLMGAMTENDIKYQSTKAGRLLAEASEDYSVREELIVRNGWEGVVRYLRGADVEIDAEVTANWANYLQDLANS